MKKPEKKKKDSLAKTANVRNGGTCCRSKNLDLSNISITTTRMTSDQGRQFNSALDLVLTELVRQYCEGKEHRDGGK